MVDYHTIFRNCLSASGLPVYYELFREENQIPCISYMEASNNSIAEGDTLRYSTIGYLVKIWAEDIKTIQDTSKVIDGVLDEQGFIRTSSYETTDNGLVVKILRYEATVYEKN